MTGATMQQSRPQRPAARQGESSEVQRTAVDPPRDAESRPATEDEERPYAWVLPALSAEGERIVAALQRRQERSRGSWWRRAAAGRLGPLTALDREMAAVRELRELATAVLDRRGGNRYGTVVPVSEVLLLLDDPAGRTELLGFAGLGLGLGHGFATPEG